ncbi:hypothetical protein EVAR_68662_1 [Eumeta japonica]|uniref:Uncharacterized protein n=1 Tax=Eumeta variegata TaxID=151549 RepID=A0A4C2A317_EUMVA|nr:hypothetical protein EVAR_68662_1 [Eumeta japonica]
MRTGKRLPPPARQPRPNKERERRYINKSADLKFLFSRPIISFSKQGYIYRTISGSSDLQARTLIVRAWTQAEILFVRVASLRTVLRAKVQGVVSRIPPSYPRIIFTHLWVPSRNRPRFILQPPALTGSSASLIRVR